MKSWQDRLRFDPIEPMLASSDEALVYWVRRDLLGEETGTASRLWELPSVGRILKRQRSDGSWPRKGREKHRAINYGIVETWRYLRLLVQQYGMTGENRWVRAAAEYLLAAQTTDGDIRGILANQYATYYTGAILAVLIEAGYADDPRVEHGIEWLLSMRQDDGGWAVPMITHRLDRETQYRITTENAPPLEPDRAKPFSHNWTGMVIRAFAAHPEHCTSGPARRAAVLLKSRFFQPDAYSSYRDPKYWVRFGYPFWWNNLVAALDSITRIGVGVDHLAGDTDVASAVDWLIDNQAETGLWWSSYLKPAGQAKESAKSRSQSLWVTLAICRILKRMEGDTHD